MNNIIEITTKRVFSLGDAQNLIPLVLRMTENANVKIRGLLQNLEIKEREDDRCRELETEIDLTIRCWQQKIEKLGAVAKGLWLVDFDNGEGYFCWKFPEQRIRFFHGYQDGFTGRKALQENDELIGNEH